MDLLLKFKDHLTQGKNQPSKATVKNYLADLRKFIRWYEKTYQRLFHPLAISPAVIEAYKANVTDTRSLKRYLSSLRKFFQYLYQLGAIPANPFDKAAEEKEQEINPWKLKEFKAFLYSDKASKLTIKNYLIDIRQFVEWLKEVLETEARMQRPEIKPIISEGGVFARIDAIAIDEYKNRLLTERQLSPVSINRKLSSLRRYIAWLNEKQIIQKDVIITDLTRKDEFASENKAEPEALVTVEPELALEDLRDVISLETEKEIKSTQYSKFPPLRLLQKSKRIITLTLDLLIILPIIRLLAAGKYSFWKLKGRPVFAPVHKVMGDSLKEITTGTINEAVAKKSNKKPISSRLYPNAVSTLLQQFNRLTRTQKEPKKLRVSNLPKSMYAPLKISTKGLPWTKKLLYHLRHTRPSWYKKYNSYAIVRYFHFAIFLIFTTSVGFGLYHSFFDQPRSQKPALAALPAAPPRILSFQGRLTDATDTPITAATNLRFAIYNSESASGSALLWEEVQNIAPDQDGIFSAILGKKTPISQSLFSNNPTLYLGVTVSTDSELIPRQQLATVAYAANAETLQGLVPITQADAGTANVVLALDSAGNLTIGGSASPKFEATGGTFTLSGKVLSLTTTQGSNGNVVINPDGTGIVDIKKPIQNTTGAVQINDALSITSDSDIDSAFTINQTGTGPLISATSNGTAKFSLDNTGSGTFANNLTINGNSLQTGASVFNLLTTNAININFGTTASAISIASSSGTTTINNALTVAGAATLNSTLTVNGLATFTGGATVPSGQSLTISGVVASDLIPSTNGSFDIGSGSRFWKNEYLTNLFMAPTATTSGFWQRFSDGLSPINTSDNLLVGRTALNTAPFEIFAATGNATTSGTFTFNTTGTIQTTNNQSLVLGGNTTGYLLLQPQNGSGRVGIDTANPLATLDVNGNASVSGNLTFNSAGVIQTTGNQTLTFGGNTTGNIILQPLNGNGMIGINTANPLATVDLRGSSGTTAVMNLSGQTSFAALTINNTGSGDLLTASSSGTTKLTVTSNGTILPGTDNSQNIGSPILAWNTIYANAVIPGSTGIQGYWQRNNNSLAPTNLTDDLLLGATATTSAKFGFINVADGTPTASISANNGANATFLTGNGNLATTNAQTLTIGGATTGNITLSPINGSGTVTSTGTFNLALGKTYQIDGTDVLSASALGSGVTWSSLAAVGTLTTGTWNASVIDTLYGGTGQDFSAVPQGAVPYFSTTGVMSTLTAGTPGQCLVTNGTAANPSWTDCTSGTNTTNWWTMSDGALNPINNTADFMIGGNATASAKFAVININSGTPTATISANNGDNATFLTGAGNLGTTNAQTLTIGGATTGNITLDSGSGSINLANATNFAGLATFNAGATITAGQNLTFGGITGNNAVLYASAGTGITTSATTNTSNLCLVSGVSSPTWASCPGGGGGSAQWTEEGNVLYPTNTFDELLMGGNATASAKFAVLNMASGTPTASISAGTTGLILGGDGSLQALRNGALILGGNTTGNITLSPLNGSGTVTSTGTFNLAFGKTFQINNTDVLSATALGSGVTGSSLTSVGTLTSGTWNASTVGIQYGGTGQDFSTVPQGAIPYFSATGVINTLAAGTSGQCLVTNGAAANPSWSSCGSASGSSWFTQNNGALFPINSTLDLLVGGTATSSAKFAVLNITSGTPTASISATSTGLALAGDGSIQSLRNGTLNLGGNTTGNITFSPLNGTGISIFNGKLSLNTSTPMATLDVRGNSATTPAASVSANTNFAAMVIDNADSGDLFTASKSGATKFTIFNNGNVAIANLANGALYTSGSNGLISSEAQLATSRGGTGADLHTIGAGVIPYFTSTGVMGGASSNFKWDNSNQYLNIGAVLSSSNQGLSIVPAASNYLGLIIQGRNAQSADLLEIQNSSSTVLAKFNGNGALGIGAGTDTLLGTADIRALSGTLPVASVSGKTSFSAMVVDNSGSGDLFTASSAGKTLFTVQNNGNLFSAGNMISVAASQSGAVNDGSGTFTNALGDQGSYIPNSSFESNVNPGFADGWFQTATGSATITNDTTTALHGDASMKIVFTNSSTAVYSACVPKPGNGTLSITLAYYMKSQGTPKPTVRGYIDTYSSKANCQSNTNSATVGPASTGAITTSFARQASNTLSSDSNTWMRVHFFIACTIGCTSATVNIDAVSVSMSNGTGLQYGLDYAENYPADPNDIPEAGDVVSMTTAGQVAQVGKARIPMDQNLLGVVSTKPGQVLDDGSIPDPKVPIALKGRVPVKVSAQNGIIHKGDYLTSSDIPGVAVKATQSGEMLGKAMEDYTDTSGIGTITVFIGTGYADPYQGLISLGDFTLFAQELAAMNGTSFGVKDASGNQITHSAIFSDGVIGNLRAGYLQVQGLNVGGYIQAQTINVAGSLIATKLQANSLAITTDDVLIGNQTLHDYITTIVGQKLAQTATASAIATVAEPPVTGSDLSISNDATISGTLRTNRLIAGTIDGLDDKLATLAALINSAVYNNSQASPSATPTPTSASEDESSSSSAYPLQPTTYPLNNNYSDISSLSAQLSNLTAEFATFNQGIIALGPSSMTDVAVSNQLAIGHNMTIADNSINTIGADLNIQPFKQGKISFMADAVVIDTDGNMTVNGNAIFTKDVKIKGKLAANIIVPVPDEDLIVQLSDSDNGGHNKFEVKNASGSSVLSINHLGDLIASGSGSFSSLATDALNIVRGAQADTSITESVASSSAGKAIIKAHQTERTIYSPYVKADSLIYVTATSNTQGQVPYVARQTAEDTKIHTKGSFTVQIPVDVAKDIKFNWWIVN